MRPGGHPVAARLGADRVYAEVVVFASAEQDVGVALAQHREPELGERGLVQSPARGEIADADFDMVDDLAHGTESTARFDATPSGVLQ